MIDFTEKLELKYKLYSRALSGTVESWHCGQDLKGGNFSLDFLGGGEGINYLGPGIYFVDNKILAERYAKYHKKPYLYHVSIETDTLYDPVYGEPLHLREKALELQNKIRQDFKILENKSINSSSSFKYGKFFMGFLNQKLGPAKAIQLMKEFGINGIYEIIGGGAIEYCIYNLSLIKIINKEQLAENNEPVKNSLKL